MSSPYPPMVHHPRHADEDPTVGAASRSAGRVSFGSVHTGRSKFGNKESSGFAKVDSGANAAKLGFSQVESFTIRASTEKSTPGEEDYAELDKPGLHQAEDVDLEVKREESRLGFGAGGYGAGSGVGGKLRSLRRGNKRTPYDRPATGRHATPGGSAAMAAASPSPKLTVASRLRESASRFIYSSASYVFSALFKRVPPSVKANGESKHTGVSITADEEISKETLRTPIKQIDLTSGSGPASQVPELVDAGGTPMDAERRVLDIVQVEEILKQKTWSREQVNRLTQILQTRVSENDAANPIVEEAEKTEAQPKPKAKDSSPVQVARAYMGEQATRPSGIAATVRKSSFLSTEVKPSPVRTLENRYLYSPFSRNWAGSSPAVRMPKRSLAREDDLASMGPVRRVRRKTSMLTNGSPYSSRMTGLSKHSETWTSSPPSQSSQTALKILETLEKLSPSPQAKFLEVSPEKSTSGLQALEKFTPTCKGKFSNEIVGVAGTSTSEQTPESSKAREKVLAQNPSSIPSPKSTELKPISKIPFGGMNLSNSGPVKKSVAEAPSSISESYNSMPVLGKGFRMNAVFEECISNEEAELQVKRHEFTESRDRTALHNLKEEATATPDSVVVSSAAANFSGSFLLDPVQASTPSVLKLKSCSVLAASSLPDKPEPSVTAVSQDCVAAFPSFSLPPETRSTLSGDAASSPAAAVEVKLSMEKVLKGLNSAEAKPALPSLFGRQIEASEMTTASTTTMAFLSTYSEFSTTGSPLAASVGTIAPASLGNASTDAMNAFLSPVPISSKTGMDVPEVENVVTMATESPAVEKLAEVDTMATDFMAEEVDASTLAPPASPMPNFLSNANVQPSTGSPFSFATGVSNTSSSAITLPFGGGLGTASSGASAASSSAPSLVFGGQSSTASVGQASNSLIGGSSSFPSAAFTFGGQSSNASVGQVPTFAMGVSASSSSSATSFAFGGQLGTAPVGQVPSFVAKPSGLFDQSGTGTTVQGPFGALPTSPANPFSSTAGSLSSPFMFGSSTAAAFGSSIVSSTSSVFTSSSSGPPSFGASSTFQFGASAGPSPSTSAPSMSSVTANSFSTSPFSSSLAPTLSATPTFSFGSSAASSSSAGSAPSGPLFAFGAAQSNPFAANPFSSSGTQNPAPIFNFGAAAMAATPSPFSSTGSPTSMFASNAAPNISNMFAFGSNLTPSTSSPFAFGSGQQAPDQASTPAPFAFGGQTAAVPPASGQPFGFGGGQPAAAAPNPFSTVGTTQPGGFALGATSGDKSGRKYIKAKRLGGTKRGK